MCLSIIPLPSSLCKDLAEVCKRDGTERDEKGVDRVLGLGSSRYVVLFTTSFPVLLSKWGWDFLWRHEGMLGERAALPYPPW